MTIHLDTLHVHNAQTTYKFKADSNLRNILEKKLLSYQ